MDIREQSDLQLLRISRGAHELTNMIDSLSKAASQGSESIQAANGLLRGSLELQESLLTLSRLQNVSRRMSKIDMRQIGREEGAEENYFEAIGSKSCENIYWNTRWQEPRLSVDGSLTNSVKELKQVIRDRLCKQNFLSVNYDNEKAYSKKTLKFNFISQERLKAPNLIAKLMGLEECPSEKEEEKMKKVGSYQPEHKSLEEIIEQMKIKGILSDHSEGCRAKTDAYGINFNDHENDVPPIVIMKSLSLAPWETEEISIISEKISAREKITLAELLLEDKASDHGYILPNTFEQSEVKSIEKYNTEPLQKLSTGVAASQRQQKKEVIKESKMIQDPNKPVIKIKKFVESEEMKVTGLVVNPNSAASTMPMLRKPTVKVSSKAYKGVKQNAKDNSPEKATSLSSNCSLDGENILTQVAVRKFPTTTKADDQRFKCGKLGCSATDTHTISRSNRNAFEDDLPKQAKKEPAKSVNKENRGMPLLPKSCYPTLITDHEIRKDHKIFCEMMPRANQAGRNSGLIEQPIMISFNKSTTKATKSQHLVHQLLSSQSLCEYAHDLLRIKSPQTHGHAKIPKEQEVGGTQLLVDCAKELMVRRSHVSISQMFQNHARERLSLTFKHLLEETSHGIENLSSYSEIGDYATSKNSLYIILEKDLQCNKMMTNASWDDGWENLSGAEEVVQIVTEVVEQISFVLIMETVVDLVA